jgi:hypothetical protein
MTKQFAFQKFLWDCATIDWHKASILPWTQLMDCPRRQLLSSAAFTRDQDRRVTIGQSGDHRTYNTHPSTIPDQRIIECTIYLGHFGLCGDIELHRFSFFDRTTII